MSDNLSPIRAMLLGLFVLASGGLAAAGVFAIGQHEWLFAETYELRAEFPSIGGVGPGTRVRVQGIDAGVVDRIVPPQQPGDAVTIYMRLDKSFCTLVRTDAVAELPTQGVVGAKVVEIRPGSPAAQPAGEGELIRSQPPVELSAVLSDAYQTGQELREVGQKLSSILNRVDNLTAGVERGEGSLGKFVTTDDAHVAALELMESGDKMMTSLDESVTAVRRVWPLRDYFTGQGMSNPDEILYRPGAKREVRQFATDQLFDAGRSVLTRDGRRRLDGLAPWLSGITHDESEIVVAAFNQDEPNNTRAQKLTQEQAEAVVDYLKTVHSVHKLGFFARRDVTAAGFGNAVAESSRNAPHRRVEVTVFVPEQ